MDITRSVCDITYNGNHCGSECASVQSSIGKQTWGHAVLANCTPMRSTGHPNSPGYIRTTATDKLPTIRAILFFRLRFAAALRVAISRPLLFLLSPLSSTVSFFRPSTVYPSFSSCLLVVLHLSSSFPRPDSFFFPISPLSQIIRILFRQFYQRALSSILI